VEDVVGRRGGGCVGKKRWEDVMGRRGGGCGGQKRWRMLWAEEVGRCGGQEIEGTVMFQNHEENISPFEGVAEMIS
jgi:hypothetical protein